MTNASNAVDDYIVTLSSSQDFEITTSSNVVMLNLSQNANNTVQVKARNCIGSSMTATLGPLLFGKFVNRYDIYSV